ncbi:hypothetical protein PHLCEN_2v4996 [Hermanssonia centrifuga]|uniref:Uncharacterized protein n=1 Tax=Hermanssonia centrifuga TaxID=98765 RepID=A0A2R6PC59_9APHY|nr:hypothetical protein PHLCEN_2v4996 [Hermanssonia centrifuga]
MRRMSYGAYGEERRVTWWLVTKMCDGDNLNRKVTMIFESEVYSADGLAAIG